MRISLMVMAVGLVGWSSTVAIEPDAGSGRGSVIAREGSIDNEAYINANRIFMFITNTSVFGRDVAGVVGTDYGTYFPCRAGEVPQYLTLSTSPLYAAGLWLGGKVDGEVRVALAEYASEYVPGPMAGGTYQPDNPAYKVYRLYKDSLAGNPNADYLNWPVDQGAPLDEYGNPLMRGDQTVWTVYNDADPSAHQGNVDAGETEPLGIEVRQTIWASDPNTFEYMVIPQTLVVEQAGTSPFGVDVRMVSGDAIPYYSYAVVVRRTESDGCAWDLTNTTTGQVLLENQTDSAYYGIQGLSIVVHFGSNGSWSYASAVPANISPVAYEVDPWYSGGRWFTGGHSGSLFYGGVFMEPEFWGGTTVDPGDIKPIEIRFRPMASYTDLNGDGRYTIGEPYVVDEPGQCQHAFMYGAFSGSEYAGFYSVPFSVFDVTDTLNPRQLNVVIRDRDGNHRWDLHVFHDPSVTDTTGLQNGGDYRNNYCWILDTDYDPTGTLYGDGIGGSLDFFAADGGSSLYDAMWMLWLNDRGNACMLAEEGVFGLDPEFFVAEDTFTFTTPAPVWADAGPENQSVYVEYRLHNKGGNTIESCYVALWTDPDLGLAGDDLVGCDTLQDLFFCYNESNVDARYGEGPPAVGFKVLRGPLVQSAGDTAWFGSNPVVGYANLGMTAFVKYINGTDPDNCNETFCFMRGVDAKHDCAPYIYDGDTLTYWHSGDPVAGTGDLDEAGADRRMMAAMGPFTFNPGDSQYVLIRMAVGQGTDHLNSITKVKEILSTPEEPYHCCRVMGNVDGSADGEVTMGDLVRLIDYLFISLVPTECMDEANVDLSADDLVTVGDMTLLIDYLFISYAALPPCP